MFYFGKGLLFILVISTSMGYERRKEYGLLRVLKNLNTIESSDLNLLETRISKAAKCAKKNKVYNATTGKCKKCGNDEIYDSDTESCRVNGIGAFGGAGIGRK
ncbi:uncharacterized protein LOC127730859 isoform X1 [Mytilus californianus]|uniref:uncharacterized protein LOC127730859 isoform X1 n=2 Tax=Mytilus californianus TaxID=6549 RepID=UPI0022469CFF|nr:uncharacterized protein LOC127730859 isoform X1 [Mytilus californianus]